MVVEGERCKYSHIKPVFVSHVFVFSAYGYPVLQMWSVG